MSKKWLTIGVVLGLLAGIMITMRLNAPAHIKADETRKDEKGQVVRVTGEVDIQNAFAKVADEVGPAVVTISTESVQRVQGFPSQFYSRRFGNRGGFTEQDPFEEFFDEFFGGTPYREFKQQGLGSGFIIDKEGYVLTNYHVVAGANKIKITLPDGRSFEGALKGADERSDLAIVKINANDLPMAKLGDSDSLKTGEWVVAIGNPFGHILKSPKPTITVGVVSALHRQIPAASNQGANLDMIQTDAAINSGNSGGPLCNIKGEVVGINVAIFSTSGGNLGIGFAIPVNLAKDVLNELIEGKRVAYGWFGVQAQEITDELAAYFNLPKKEGVIVAKVFADSPALNAGIKEGDILIEFNKERIVNPVDLVRNVGRVKPGTTVEIKFIRDRVERAVQAEIGKRPSGEEILQEEVPKQVESSPWRGIKVADITDEIAQQLGIRDKNGVVITEVDPSSPFYIIGMRRGVVIREINRNPIRNVSDFNKITREAVGNVLIRTDSGYFIIQER